MATTSLLKREIKFVAIISLCALLWTLTPDAFAVSGKNKNIKTVTKSAVKTAGRTSQAPILNTFLNGLGAPNATNGIDGDFYLDNSYNSGRVTIEFNARPASNFLNAKYFKAQRKKIQRIPSRWESLDANISLHSWKPEVYVDFPSNDATPSYTTSNKEYFETGYKYRIILSKDIGI